MTAAQGRTRLRNLGRFRHPGSWVLLAVAGLLTGLIMLALVAAALDDAQINARTGYTSAQVIAVTPVRTLVQFAAPDGQVYSPDEGVAYPSGLQVGQLVRVEYDSANPEQVRVAGRTWATGVVPAAITLVVLWTLVVPIAWWLRRRPYRHVVGVAQEVRDRCQRTDGCAVQRRSPPERRPPRRHQR